MAPPPLASREAVREERFNDVWTHELNDAAARTREPQAERHASAEAEPAPRQAEIGLRTGAHYLIEHGERVANRLIDDDIVLAQYGIQRRTQKIGRDRAGRSAHACSGSARTISSTCPSTVAQSA